MEHEEVIEYDDDPGDDYDLGALEDIGINPMALMQRLARRAKGLRARLNPRRVRVRRPRRVAYAVPAVRTALATPPVVAPQPGQAEPALKYAPFGLGQTQMGVGITTATLTQQPQLPLKLRKLTIAVGRTGAGVAGALVLITAFTIGTFNQLTGSGAVDTAMYIANAEGATMDLTPGGPGLNVTMNFMSTIAPAAGEFIDISASFLAQAVTT